MESSHYHLKIEAAVEKMTPASYMSSSFWPEMHFALNRLGVFSEGLYEIVWRCIGSYTLKHIEIHRISRLALAIVENEFGGGRRRWRRGNPLCRYTLMHKSKHLKATPKPQLRSIGNERLDPIYAPQLTYIIVSTSVQLNKFYFVHTEKMTQLKCQTQWKCI